MSIISAELTKISVKQLRDDEDQLHQPVTDDRGAASQGQYPRHSGCHRQRQPRRSEVYLRPGLSYGGPCFPRDNRLLAYTAQQLGLEAPLAEASDRVNQRTNLDLFEKVQRMLSKGDTVAVLG